jgi:hypothetical protein
MHRRDSVFIDLNNVATRVWAARETLETSRPPEDDRLGVTTGLDHKALLDPLIKKRVETVPASPSGSISPTEASIAPEAGRADNPPPTQRLPSRYRTSRPALQAKTAIAAALARCGPAAPRKRRVPSPSGRPRGSDTDRRVTRGSAGSEHSCDGRWHPGVRDPESGRRPGGRAPVLGPALAVNPRPPMEPSLAERFLPRAEAGPAVVGQPPNQRVRICRLLSGARPSSACSSRPSRL